MTEKSKNRIRTAVSLSVILFVAPLIALAAVFSESKYYALFTLIAALISLVPFFLLIENRNLGVQRLVPTAIMTAVAVAGRAAFFFVPQFKPIIAIVIITGAALGAESGFLCGSLSMLCSNFIFGQGPWTPFQMLACGLVGFISGFLGRNKITKSVIFLCVWGFMSGILYGLIVDTWSVLSISSQADPAAVLSTYMAGLLFNLILAAATAVFLALIAKPLLKKLARVKMKYGL